MTTVGPIYGGYYVGMGWPIRGGFARRDNGVPVRYVLFDLLYHAGRCRMRESLMRRRGLLAELCEKLDVPDVVFSYPLGEHRFYPRDIVNCDDFTECG